MDLIGTAIVGGTFSLMLDHGDPFVPAGGDAATQLPANATAPGSMG